MKISVTLPTEAGRARGEHYATVMIEPNGAPFCFVFRYTDVEHDDGSHELVCMESGIAQLFDEKDKPAAFDPDDAAAVTSAVVGDFREQWTRYERAARVSLASAYGEPDLTARPRERRVLSDEFLADIVARRRAAERKGLPGTTTVAREERVGASTVRNWLRHAKKRGIEAS